MRRILLAKLIIQGGACRSLINNNKNSNLRLSARGHNCPFGQLFNVNEAGPFFRVEGHCSIMQAVVVSGL